MRRCDIELWCEVDGFSDYECSTLGRIRRKHGRPSSRIHAHTALSGWLDSDGYRRYELRRDNTKHLVRGHVVVATTFYGPAPDGHECRHLDGQPGNNRIDNLTWGTDLENKQDRAWHRSNPGVPRPQWATSTFWALPQTKVKACANRAKI